MLKVGSKRYLKLKELLEKKRREILGDVKSKVGELRKGVEQSQELEEMTEANNQEELNFTLAKMKADTLNRINEAILRLEQGKYGNCKDCEEEIAEPRLKALPFAVRCKDCQEAHETANKTSAESTGVSLDKEVLP